MAKSYFDAVMEDNKKLANTAIPEGAMSYADYVTASGVDSAGDLEAAKKSAETGYLAAVESAERAHDRAIGTYGQNAEAMARAGLSGSGYSDYITGNAYAAKQGSIDAAKATRQASIDAAESTKRLTDEGTQQGYLDYIENYKTQKKADSVNAISDIVNMDLTGEGARSYLEALGLGSESDKILGITNGILGKRAEAEAKAKADAADANYGSALEAAIGYIGQDVDPNLAIKLLQKTYGYSQEQALEVLHDAQTYRNTAKVEPPETKIDFTASGHTLENMALLYAMTGIDWRNNNRVTTGEAKALDEIALGAALNEIEANIALTKGPEALEAYWEQTLRAKGYTADEVDAMLEEVRKMAPNIKYGWGEK